MSCADRVAGARLFRQKHLGPEILLIAAAWEANPLFRRADEGRPG